MVWQIQSNFTGGVLDKKLKGRIDLQLYYNGMETGKNIILLPQGGATRRPGFEYLATLAGKSRLFSFQFNTSQLYVVAFDSSDWYVYNTSGTQLDTGSHSWGADIFEADYVQSGDVLILVHEDQAPRRLKRTGASSFNWSDISLKNIPQYNYDDGSSPTPTSHVADLTFTDFTESDRYRLVLDEFLTEEISWSATVSDNRSRIKQALLDLPITDSASSTVTVTESAGVYTVTLSGNSAGAYGDINGVIVESVSASAQVACSTTTTGVSKKEDVWSSTRGWPKTVLFHEGRLVFGGSKSRPATVWLSFANDFFNFRLGTGRADEAIEATLDTDQLNEIVGLSTNRNLQIFTSGQEFFVPVSPITPETIVIKPQSAYGAKQVKPQVVDGFTCYVQSTGKAIRRFQLSEFETSYDSVSVSLLAPELISDPVDTTIQRGVFNIDAAYFYVVNDDGTMAVYLSKKEEGLNAWALWDTVGSFEYVCSVGSDLFASVKRTINGSTVRFLEKLYSTEDKTMWCDAGVRYDQSASTTVSGFSHLNGQSIRLVADGAVQDDVIPASGSITVSRETESGWAGLEYNPLIKTMPANVNTQAGQLFPVRCRFVRIRPLLLESLGVYMSNGTDEIFLPDRQFDIEDFDSAPGARSGIGQGIRFLGWDYSPQLSIYQKDPLPFTISALAMELAK